ncbi:Conserved oligomeric Golgi complex subunit 7 (COG complex subunit 7) (Component of oligomeric Golgi complex 7), partial [Durusdinium trenchii]
MAADGAAAAAPAEAQAGEDVNPARSAIEEALEAFDGQLEGFDVTRWMNDCLRHVVDKDAPLDEGHITGLLLRLQQESQGINTRLEERMAQVLASVPRALREVERIGRDSGALLKGLGRLDEQIQAIEQGSEKAPVPTGEQSGATAEQQMQVGTLTTLEHLHVIKTNLDKTVRVVEKSANWNRLVREVEANFASRDLVGVAQRLGALRDSMELLSGMPDGERRGDVVTRMEQRLETLIGPGLREAITACLRSEQGADISADANGGEQEASNGDPEGQKGKRRSSSSSSSVGDVREQEELLRGYVDIFEKLGRLDHLCKDFAEARSSFFVEDWEAVREQARTSGWDLAHWVVRFYERFEHALEREAARCYRVFGEQHAAQVLREVAVEGFAQVVPSFQAELGAASLDQVVDTLERTCEFVDHILRVMARGVDAFPAAASVGDAFLKIATRPFAEHLESYARLELELLNTTLEQKSGRVTAATLVNLLRDPAPVQLVLDALQRSIRLSGGAKVPALLNSIDAFWADFCSRCAQVIKQTFGDTSEVHFSKEAWEERTFSALKNMQAIGEFQERLQDFQVKQLRDKLATRCQPLVDMTDPACTKDWVALSLLRASPSEAADLREICNVADAPAVSRFHATSKMLQQLVEVAQTTAYDTMLAPIQHEWDAAGRMKVWAIHTDAQLEAFASSEEETISEFGTPLKYMTRVVQHLSSLVQMLEPFGAERVSPALLPDMRLLGTRVRAALENQLELPSDTRLANLDRVEESDSNEDEEDLFSRKWLDIVARGATDRLLLQILKITVLGDKGAGQLATDLMQLEYVIDLIAAPQDPVLVDFRSLLQVPLDDLASQDVAHDQ